MLYMKQKKCWSYLNCHHPGVWELQQVVVEVLHPADVDPHVGGPVECPNQSPGPIVHAHPGNDLSRVNTIETLQHREKHVEVGRLFACLQCLISKGTLCNCAVWAKVMSGILRQHHRSPSVIVWLRMLWFYAFVCLRVQWFLSEWTILSYQKRKSFHNTFSKYRFQEVSVTCLVYF